MQSMVTSKYQTTIPKTIRSQLRLSVSDTLTSDQEMIADFIALPGLRLIHEFDLESFLKLWPDQISDFGDATVATFDKRFARSLHAAGLSTGTG